MLSLLRTPLTCLAMVALTASLVVAGDVAPFAPPIPDGCAAGCGYGYGWWPWSLYTREYIPYHALHPPVYYSYPVPRTYGYSPFAYPPGTRTPEILPPVPEIIPNHYVPQKAKETATADRVVRAPLRITNPFVVQEEKLAQATKQEF